MARQPRGIQMFLTYICLAFANVGPLIADREDAQRKVTRNEKVLTIESEGADLYDVIVHGIFTMFAPKKVRITVEGIGSLPCNALKGWVFDRDLTRFALLLLVDDGKRVCVAVDGIVGEKFTEVAGVQFSPDGKTISYGAGRRGNLFKKSNGYVVIGPKTEGPYEFTYSPVWSATGRRVAYVAKDRKDGKWRVVEGGVPGDPYDKNELLGTVFPAFTANDHHLFYAAKRGKSFYAVIDQVPSEPYVAPVSLFRFSPDGRHIAYAGNIGSKWRVILDGSPSETYDTQPTIMLFSPDSQHIAYTVKKEDAWLVVQDQVPSGDSMDAEPTRLTYSPDSRHIAYAGKMGEIWRVFVDGRSIADYTEAPGYLSFTVDSQALVISGYRGGAGTTERREIASLEAEAVTLSTLERVEGGAEILHFGEEKYGPYEKWILPQRQCPTRRVFTGELNKKWYVDFGSDHQGPWDGVPLGVYWDSGCGSIGYVATLGKEYYIVTSTDKKGPFQSAIGPLLFPKGGGFVFNYQVDKNWFIYTPKGSYGPYEVVSPWCISPDGQHIAHEVKHPSGWCVAVDGVPGSEEGKKILYMVWVAANTIRYMLVKPGGAWYLIEETIG